MTGYQYPDKRRPVNIDLKHKRGNKNLDMHKIHVWHRRMLSLCLLDLHSIGMNGHHIEVIFQIGHSLNSDKYLGLCRYDHTIFHWHRIWIYSYRHRVPTVMNTIAHEMGHIRHHFLVPDSINWGYKAVEEYANTYAIEMVALMNRTSEETWEALAS